MKNLFFLFCRLFFILHSLNSWSLVKDPAYDELEGAELVAALIRDQKFSQAEAELKKNSFPELTQTQLWGDLSLAQNQGAQALTHYLKLPNTAPFSLLLARAYFQNRQFAPCRLEYAKSRDLWMAVESDILKKATCETQEKNLSHAFSALNKGLKQFPASFAIIKDYVQVLIDLGIKKTALDFALENSQRLSANQFLTLAELFHANNETQLAWQLLEIAKIKYPLQTDIHLTLAQLNYSLNNVLATAENFASAALISHNYAFQAAEMMRHTGQLERVKFWQLAIDQENERIKSKMALLIDQQQYPLVASMAPVLERSTLIRDQDFSYALAYSLGSQGDRQKSLKFIRQLTRSDLKEKGHRLEVMLNEIAAEKL